MQPAVRPLLGEWQEDAPEGFALEGSKGVMAMVCGVWLNLTEGRGRSHSCSQLPQVAQEEREPLSSSVPGSGGRVRLLPSLPYEGQEEILANRGKRCRRDRRRRCRCDWVAERQLDIC